jgi:flavin-dependent dehydrogenase
MMVTTPTTQEYDVVIMGAGFAGLCQARHLMLNIPNLKIALIDPRPEQRQEKDLKIGESTIEIAAMFLAKELGLYEYLIEEQVPKIGLNYHWPKQPTQTDTLDDYYHVWSNRQVAIAAFQINRAKFETDLLAMNKKMGVDFYNGRVVDVDLTPGDTLKTVMVKQGETEQELKAKHVVDAAGRKFIIGRKTDNILSSPEDLLRLNNGSAWVRVKNVDRTVFHDGYDPDNVSTSHYYGTNHYFGHGHWCWMIPIDTQQMELSIGMMHHHEQLPADQINTEEKFLSFLKENQTILYNLIQSGEKMDFHYWPKVAHKSKMMFSPDNWYVIGDAAYIYDAFYSYGTSTVAIAIESVTEIIRAKLADEADAEEKCRLCNEFNLMFALTVNHLYKDHGRQLGHASVMSWRIYFEYMWWFGLLVPMYVGKWHLDPTFISVYLQFNQKFYGFYADVCQQFNQLVDRNVNIGLLDCWRADQLPGGYYTSKHFDSFLTNSKLEPRHCNVFASLKTTCLYVIIWYLMFGWKGFGLRGILHPKHIYHIFMLLGFALQAAIGESIYKWKTRNRADNTEVARMRQEFKQYRYRPYLRPWLTETAPAQTPAEQRELSMMR